MACGERTRPTGGVARRRRGKSLKPFYYIFLTINAITLAVILFFFMWGLSDGTVSSFNILLWLAMLGIPSATLLGGWVQWGKGNQAFALILLLLPSVPALLFFLFFFMLIVLAPD